MGFVLCALPHAVHLVLPDPCLLGVVKNYPGLSFPETAAQVEYDFASSENGVLVLVDEKQIENVRISFCTPHYELVCGLTPQQDAWFGLRLAPLSLRSHNLIAHGAVEVVPQSWHVYKDLTDLNAQIDAAPAQTGIEAILEAWKQTRQPAPVAPVASSGQSADELAFLANVDTLIDLACQVELEQAARQERVPVKAVEAATLARGSAYRFTLTAPAKFRVGEYLQAGVGAAKTGYEGVVVEAAGSSLVMRFFQPVEPKLLQRVEWLLPKISTKQYTIQHAAVNALRNGESLNPRLLPLIVENRFETYAAPSITTGTGKPNPAQKTLIERALLIPDLLLALGPPGTGKTDTIREIVARQAALGKKVLVTSKNNKAVDNVLEGLKNVQALRIGREEAVTAEVRPLLIDNQADALRQKILDGIQPVEDNLERVQRLWPQIQQVIDNLAQLGVDWRLAQAGLEQKLSDLTNWQRASHIRVERVQNRQKKHFQLMNSRLTQAAHRTDVLRQRLEGLQKLCQLPLLGAFFTLLADQLSRDWQDASAQYRSAQQEVRRSRESLRLIWDSYRQFATASEMALQFKRAVIEAEAALTNVRAEIDRALDELTRLSEYHAGDACYAKGFRKPRSV